MNWLDILILGLVLLGAYSGLRTGLIRTIVTLAGLGLAIPLAGRFYAPLAQQLAFVQGENQAKVVAFAVILISVMVGAALIGNFLRSLASWLLLGWVDRLGGLFIGAFMAATLCGLLVITLARFPLLGLDEVIRESRIAPFFLSYFPGLLGLLPEEFGVVRFLLKKA